ncbi:hypothetical protein ACGFZ9_51960 [Streptomyces mirabilis]|uniref:hypothetical protein n=1 Tax=Streptomyces mirabilis TaxID=68239 RepID=UPI003719ECC4
MALEIEPFRWVDIGVEQRTAEDWRYAANRWPKEPRREGVSFTVKRDRSPGSVQTRTPITG